ncbi:MAG: GNAT family protein [Pseudomonadota bacterium]
MTWSATLSPLPGETPLEGRTCSLLPVAWPEPGTSLVVLMAAEPHDLWTYMPIQPPGSPADLRETIHKINNAPGQAMMVITSPSGAAMGMGAFLRIRPEHGSAELGSIAYSHLMQRSVAGTEAMFLMMRHLFDDLGYRRCEWKCHAGNRPSNAAAKRLGFVYEGTFRQDMWLKGANRDTAWYSIADKEWPSRKAALEAWLAPENFDAEGRQRAPLRRLVD